MEHKKSIVNYDDDDDTQSMKTSPKEIDKLVKSDKNSIRYKGALKSEEKEKAKKAHLRNKEFQRKEQHSSHHRHHSRSSKDHHHRHHHVKNRSPSHRRRISRSRSHDHIQRDANERSNSSNYNSKHKSKSGYQSKKDRSRSRSKEPRNYHHRHKSRSPKRRSDFSRKISTDVHDHGNLKKSEDSRLDNSNLVTKSNVPTNGPVFVAEQKLPTNSTASTIPKYYNAKTVNPSRIATQEEKRKLLWGDSKKDKSTNIWTNLKFQGEHGSEMTEKFRKLMGIKSNGQESASCDTAKSSHISDISSTQEKLFQNLDMQYSLARMSTHTHRGVGLGFSNNRLL